MRSIDLPANRLMPRHTRLTTSARNRSPGHQFGSPLLARAAHPCDRSRGGDGSITRRSDKRTHPPAESLCRLVGTPPDRSVHRLPGHSQPTDGLPDRRPVRLSRLARVARPAAGGRLSRAGRGAGKSFSGRLPFLRKIFVPDWGSTSSGQQFSLKMDMVI